MKNISLIAAIDLHRVIGFQGKLPWSLPNDMAWFRQHTLGKRVVMGRKTFESLNGRPLAKRENFLISRETFFHHPALKVFQSPQQWFEGITDDAEYMIIGGESIYRFFLPHANKLYLTQVHAAVQGDVYFPSWDPKQWRLTFSVHQPSDANHEYALTFQIYEKLGQP